MTEAHADYCDKKHISGEYLCIDEKNWRDSKQCFDPKCETKTPHTHWSVWTATTNETILEGLEKFRLERRLAVIKFALYVALVVIIPITVSVFINTIKHW